MPRKTLENALPATRRSQPRTAPHLGLLVLSLVIAVCFGLYLWTGRFQYERIQTGALSRTNRFTGQTQLYAGARGWITLHR